MENKNYTNIFLIIVGIILLIIFTMTTMKSENVDTLEVVVGIIDTGNLESLHANDNNLLNISEVVGAPAFLFYMNITDTDLTDGKIWSTGFKGFYDGSLGHTVNFDIYDWTLLDWVTVGSVNESVLPTIRYNNFTSQDYINNDGDINTRIIHPGGGNVNHDIGLDYVQIWEQNFDMNDTFNQQIPMVINNLYTNPNTWNSNDYDLTVNESVIVNNTGNLNMNDTANTLFGLVNIQSGGSTILPSGILSLITNFDNSGTVFHNTGTISLDTGANHFMQNNGGIVEPIFYNIISNQGTLLIYGDVTIINGFDIDSVTVIRAPTSETTLTMGDNTQSGTIFGPQTFEFDNNNINSVNIYGANINFPAILTTTAIDWDDGGAGALINLKWVDIRTPITTNTGPLTITLDGYCIFDSITISNSDTIDLNGNKLNSSGTLFISNTAILDFENSILDVNNLNTVNAINNTFIEENADLLLQGNWNLNSALITLNLNTLVVNGTITFNTFSLQTANNLDIYLNHDSFRSSTGELNISADSTFPLRLFGNNINTTIDLSNMSDYFLFNIEISDILNIDNEYITVSGLDVIGNTLIDFLPPDISFSSFINNTIFDKLISSTINLTFDITELSFLHSYNYTIQHVETGLFILQRQFNFSSAVNFTEIIRNLDITFYPNGNYWINISAYDTHNLLKSEKQKDKMKNIKIEIKNSKIGFYDNQKLEIEKHKEIKFKNFRTNKTYYELYFNDDINSTITYQPELYNFKMLHIAKLDSDNNVVFEIRGNDITYLPNSIYAGHFIIGGSYFYEMQDFIENGGTVEISNKRINKDYQYYVITLSKDLWNRSINKYVEIDPLSGSVNNGQSFQTFEIINNQIYNAFITSMVPEPSYQTEIFTLTGSDDNIVNVTNYVWTSNIDGVFSNNSNNPITNNNLSAGNHIISLFTINEFGELSNSDTLNHIVAVIPIAQIVQLNINGLVVNMLGTGTTHNNSISGYAWSSNVTGEFSNSTSNPIVVTFLSSGGYQISFQIKDQYGRWSVPVFQNITLSNLTVTDGLENWWVNGSTFLIIMSYLIAIFGLAWFIFFVAKHLNLSILPRKQNKL